MDISTWLWLPLGKLLSKYLAGIIDCNAEEFEIEMVILKSLKV